MHKIVSGKEEDIRSIRDEILFEEGFNRFLSEAFDIECVPRCKVFDMFLKHGSALAIGTAVNYFSLRTNEEGSATRALLRIMKGMSPLRAQIPEHFDDFRDDIPRLLDDDRITDAHIKTSN